MKVVSIGKGMLRIIVRSKEKKARLSKIPDILIEGNRVIFPEWLSGNIKMIVDPVRKKKAPKMEQSKLL